MFAASLLWVLTAQAWPQSWPPAAPESIAPVVRRPSYSPDELRAAILSPGGVAQVRALFESAAGSAASFRFKVPVPHIAGEWAPAAKLDSMIVIPSIGGAFGLGGGRLEFSRRADPALPVMRALAAHNEDAAALGEIYSGHPSELEMIDGGDSSHILRHTLDLVARIPPAADRAERVGRALGRTVLTVVENCGENYVRALRADGGVWHIHPPHFAPDGWYVGPVPGDDEGGAAPSDFDRSSVSERGQNLTLVFQADGFDAYDLAWGRKIEYRSEEWRRSFAALHAELSRRLERNGGSE
ncbi:MAG: hypothetical protein ACHQ2Z_09660 [Elusimicrobiota bacterium]